MTIYSQRKCILGIFPSYVNAIYKFLRYYFNENKNLCFMEKINVYNVFLQILLMFVSVSNRFNVYCIEKDMIFVLLEMLINQ